MQSEELNCLREAVAFCADLNVPQAVAPFVVNLFSTYYCRSTDALAGNYLSLSEGYTTREEAQARASVLCEEYPEARIEVLPRETGAAATVEVDDCPF